MNTTPPAHSLQSLFGADVQFVPGLGYVNAPNGSGAGLGDDAAVMMVSGVDGLGAGAPQRGSSTAISIGTSSLMTALKQNVTIGGITQPLWVWLLVAGGAAGVAGWWFWLRK